MCAGSVDSSTEEGRSWRAQRMFGWEGVAMETGCSPACAGAERCVLAGATSASSEPQGYPRFRANPGAPPPASNLCVCAGSGLQLSGRHRSGCVYLGLGHLPSGLGGWPAAQMLLLLSASSVYSTPLRPQWDSQSPSSLLLQTQQRPGPLHRPLPLPLVRLHPPEGHQHRCDPSPSS